MSTEEDVSLSMPHQMVLLEEYKSPKATTSAVPFNASVLRYGSPPSYLALDSLSLYTSYFIIGILLGVGTSINSPVLAGYFNMSYTEANVLTAFVFIAWTSKVVFGTLSDCFPIMGYRRKGWMVLGWSLAFSCFCFLAIASVYEAGNASHGAIVAVAVGLSQLFAVVCLASSDALTVELAQREPQFIRGRLQSLLYGSRYFGIATGQYISGALLGSTFTASTLRLYFALAAAVSLIMIPVVVFGLKETRRHAVNCPEHLFEFWSIVQTRVFWQSLLFQFCFEFCFYVFFPTFVDGYTTRNWAHVRTTNSLFIAGTGSTVFALAIFVVAFVGTGWHWRWTTLITTIAWVVQNAIVYSLVIFDVYRDEWFYLLGYQSSNIFQGVQQLMTSLIFVEIIDVGKEGISYGMLTTMSNLGVTLAPAIAGFINSAFQVTEDDVKADTPSARGKIAGIYGIAFAMALVSCISLPLLPTQKEHSQFLRSYGGRKQPLAATLTLLLCAVGFILGLVSNLFGMFESTACLPFAGGAGC